MEYIIGIDCGGTKTEGQAYDMEGNLLSTATSGFGNLLVNYDVALSHIQSVLEQLLLEHDAEQCRAVVFGIAGIDSGGLRAKLEREFSEIELPLTFLNDGQLAHYSVLEGEEGMIVTAGTGSVFLGRQDSTWYRVGGWGHLLGDEGSAFSLAKAGIKVVLAEYDQGLVTSQFSRGILDHFQVNDVFGLVKEVYRRDKGDIASLASKIAAIAEEDSQAITLLEKNGQDLAESVITLQEKMPVSTEVIRVGLNGSVIEKNQIVRRRFFATLEKWAGDRPLVIIDKKTSCAKGGYYYTIKEGN